MLPIQLSSFVGRRSELAQLRWLLDRARLLTLTGSAGSGKTRLALELATQLQSEYRDEVFFVELAAIVDPTRVPQAVATALGIQEEVGRPLLATVVDHQRGRSCLLLLDNCEHVLEACAALVMALLSSSPALRIVATSREALHVPGETVWPAPPMSLPKTGAGGAVVDPLQSEAVHLFAERAALISPSFALTSRTAPVVARICQRLDGMPLAIELAAARLPALTVEEIESRLERRFRLLKGRGSVVVQRQQTLRAAIDWSYSLLDQQDRSLFDRLAIFAGGFNLEAAERICAGDGIPPEAMLDGVSCLVDKSMVIAAEASDGSTRYRLLETLREYGLERLVKRGEYARLAGAHARHFLDMAVTSEAHLTGRNQGLWLRGLQRNLDNLRAAMHWWHGHDPDQGLCMAAALAMFWYMLGHLSEGRQQLEAALEAGPNSGTRGAGLYGLGLLEHRHAEYEQAKRNFDAAQTLFHLAGDERGMGRSVMRSGKASFELGDFKTAKQRLKEAHQMLTAVDDRWGVAQTVHDLGVLHGEHGLRDHDQAISYFRHALAIRRELGDRHATAFTLFAFSAEPGPLKERKALLLEGIQIYEDMGDGVGIGVGLENHASLASICGHPRRAVKLLAAAQSQRVRVGGASPHRMRLRIQELVTDARQRLDESEAAGLDAEGEAMTLQEAIALATEDWGPPEEVASLRQSRSGHQLTRREVQVAGLVAEGLSNREIGSRLFISHRTAEYHVEQIRNKLGVHSRAQVAAWSAARRPSSVDDHVPASAGSRKTGS